MTRLNAGSSNRSRSTGNGSNGMRWPSPLLKTHAPASPQTSASPHISASPHTSASIPGSMSWPPPMLNTYGVAVPSNSSGGEHSPSHGQVDQPEAAVNPEERLHAANSQQSENGDHRLQVEFNSFGQPIEDGSIPYASKVGMIARSTVSSHYTDWRIVPWELKEEIWRAINKVYNVPEFLKDKAIQMANKSCRNGKTHLRKVCDKSGTVAERKANVQRNKKEEDWEKFVDEVSGDRDKQVRERGKAARYQVKALHSTGRDGIARRRHVMEQQSPTGFVSRSALFLATHVYQELPEEQLQYLQEHDPDSYELRCRRFVGMVRELQETEHYREEIHLDRDAVAKVFGTDGRGFVRGMGCGASKTELLASAIPKEQLRQENMKTRVFEDRIRVLEEKFTKLMATTSTANQGIPCGFRQPRIQVVGLRNMRGIPVAFGRLDLDELPPNDNYHSVLIGEVVLPSEDLCDDDITFADVSLGEKLYIWPQHSVCLWPVPVPGASGF